ncbi:hypothetical protein TRIP_B200303 [uncultured Desulfatiglans sp.]|nr:hypothetical protein TRIP_B200303 [uncultured Desulfatiglans sp.]
MEQVAFCRGVRENRQATGRPLNAFRGLFADALQAAASAHHLQNLLEIRLARKRSLRREAGPKGSPVRFFQIRKRVNQRQGNLPLPQVFDHRLAEYLLLCRVIQEVVHQLKGHAHMEAELRKRRFGRFSRTAQDRPALAGSRNQHRCFGLDDFQVSFFPDVPVEGMLEFQNLAFGHTGGSLRQALEKGAMPRVECHGKGLGVQEVSYEHRCVVAPKTVGRRAAAPGLRVVQDIVVQERGGVDDLENTRQPVASLNPRSKKPARKNKEERAESLSSSKEGVPGYFFDFRYAGSDGKGQFRLDFFEVKSVLVQYSLVWVHPKLPLMAHPAALAALR